MFLVPLSSLPPMQGIESTGMQETSASASTSTSFADIMREAMTTLQESQEAAAEDAYQLAMGDISSLHSMMINSAMEATAVETVVQLTSRAVSAYKEIMQMQI